MKPFTHRNPATATLLLAAVLVLAACNSGRIRGEPPLVQTGGWRLESTELALALRFRNVNDDPLPLDELSIEVLLGDEPTRLGHRQSLGIEIASGGFETVEFGLTADEATASTLEKLATGSTASVPYRLSGTVVSAGSDLPFSLEGRVYAVPGRPGEYR